MSGWWLLHSSPRILVPKTVAADFLASYYLRYITLTLMVKIDWLWLNPGSLKNCLNNVLLSTKSHQNLLPTDYDPLSYQCLLSLVHRTILPITTLVPKQDTSLSHVLWYIVLRPMVLITPAQSNNCHNAHYICNHIQIQSLPIYSSDCLYT